MAAVQARPVLSTHVHPGSAADAASDPARTLICWHATTQPFADRIVREGLAPREGRIYTALHPFWPILLKRDETRRFSLLKLALPLHTAAGTSAAAGEIRAWRFGEDFDLGAWETCLRRAVPAGCIVERVEGDDDRAWPRHAGAHGPARSGPLPPVHVLDGYDGWLAEPEAFSRRCQELCMGADANVAALASVYLNHGQPKDDALAALRRVARGLAGAIVAAPAIDPGSLRAAADVLSSRGIDWVELALELPLPRLPLPRLALISTLARHAPTKNENRDALTACFQRTLSGPQERHFAVICGMFSGATPPTGALGDANAEAMLAMVDVVRYGALGTQRGKCALDTIGLLPPELADLAFLELLRHRRAVPSRARHHLDRILKQRVDRIAPALAIVAEECDGRPQRVARWLLGLEKESKELDGADVG